MHKKNRKKLLSVITALALVMSFGMPMMPSAFAQHSDDVAVEEEHFSTNADDNLVENNSENNERVEANDNELSPKIEEQDKQDDINSDIAEYSLFASEEDESTDNTESDEPSKTITIHEREYTYDDYYYGYIYRSSEDADDFWALYGPYIIENTAAEAGDTSCPCEYFIEIHRTGEWEEIEEHILLRPKDGAEQGTMKIDSDFNWGGSAPWNGCEAPSVSVTIEGKIEAPNLSRFFAYLPEQIDIKGLGNFTGVKNIDGMFYGSEIKNFNKIDIKELNVSAVTSMSETFAGCKKLTKIDLDTLNTSNVTNMYRMFADCSSLETIDLSKFDTSKVKNMTSMFRGCAALTTLDISNFDMSSVSKNGISYMFYKGDSEKMNLKEVSLPDDFFVGRTELVSLFSGCEELTDIRFAKPKGYQCQPKDVGGMLSGCANLSNDILDNMFAAIDVTEVTNLNHFFSKWKKEQIEMILAKMNTQSVTNMNGMFKDCSFKSIDLSNLNMKNVDDTQHMFDGCTQVEKIDLSKSEFASKCEVQVLGMFKNCTNLTEIIWPEDDYNINISRMTNVFENCSSLIELDLSRFKAHNVNAQAPDFTNMFSGCSSLTSIKLGDEFYTETYACANMPNMFSGCSSLENIDISGFKLSNVNNAEGMFEGCTNLKDIKFKEGTTTNVLTNANNMFKGCANLSEIDWDVFNNGRSHTMSTAGMFSGCSSLEEIGFTEGFKTSNMLGMFEGCTSLTDVNIEFNTKDCRNMSNAFAGCENLENITWAGKFNTHDATNMSGMFSGCSSLEEIDVSNFDTSSVANMSGMFEGCTSLTKLDISNFNTSNVNNMSDMFSGCEKLEEITFCDEDSPNTFNTSKVTNMSGMFEDCSSLTELDVSSFNTRKVNDMSNMFAGCSSLETLNLDGENFVTTEEAKKNSTGMFDGLDSLEEVAFGSGFSGLQSQLPQKYWFDTHGNAYKPDQIEPGEMEYFAKPKLQTLDKVTKVVGASDFSLEVSGVLNNENTKLTWTSSKTEVAEVDTQGQISVKSPGITTIKVTHEYPLYVDKEGTGFVDAETTLIVFNMSMDSSKCVAIGAEPFVIDTAFDFGGNKDITAPTLTWSSSNTNVASINQTTGEIKVSESVAGESTITASIDGMDDAVWTCNLVVGKITIVKDTSNIFSAGSDKTLDVVIEPNSIMNETVTWQSSAPDVVSVDGSGKISAISPGTATIKASIGGIEDSYAITVAGVAFEAAEKIVSYDAEPFTLPVTVSPEGTSVTKHWESSEPSVASIDSQTGKITVHNVGITNISVNIGGTPSICKLIVGKITMNEKAMIVNRDNNSVTLTANVAPAELAERIAWSSNSNNNSVVEILAGGVTNDANRGSSTCTLQVNGIGSATVSASVGGVTDTCLVTVGEANIKTKTMTVRNGSDPFFIGIDVSPAELAKNITWSSDDEDVATVDENGKVTIVGPGIVHITAELGGKESVCEISVVDISLSHKTKTLNADGNSFDITATISPESLAKDIKWSVSDSNIAAVDEPSSFASLLSLFSTTGSSTRTVTPKSTGVVTVTADINGVKENCEVTVGRVNINAEKKTVSANDTPFPIDADISNEIASKVKWTSDNEDVATVDANGVVTVKNPGKTTIKAEYDGLEDSIELTVIGLSLDKKRMFIQEDAEPFQLTATVFPDEFADSISWSSSNPDVATVDDTGLVTLHNKTGVADITAEVNGVSAVCKVYAGHLAFKYDEKTVALGGSPIKLEVDIDEPDEISEHTIQWSSSDTSVATINETTGEIVTVGPGTTTIKVIIDGIEATCELNVVKIVFDQPSVEVDVDAEPFIIGITIEPEELADAIKWSSSDPSIASVDENTGEVTVHKPGQVNISVDINGAISSYTLVVKKLAEPIVPPDNPNNPDDPNGEYDVNDPNNPGNNQGNNTGNNGGNNNSSNNGSQGSNNGVSESKDGNNKDAGANNNGNDNASSYSEGGGQGVDSNKSAYDKSNVSSTDDAYDANFVVLGAAIGVALLLILLLWRRRKDDDDE